MVFLGWMKYFSWGLRIVVVGLLLLPVSACQPSEEVQDPVFSAVRDNDADRLGQYLAEGGNPDIKNEDGDSLLYVASGAKGGFEVAQLLILAGADLNLTSREQRTPLHTAAAWCNADIVDLLLGSGARVDIANTENEVAIDVICARPPQRREQVLALFFQAGANN